MSNITPEQVHQWVLGLHQQCQAVITDAERTEQHKYATLIQNPGDKVFLSKLLDESSQIRNSKKLARRVKELMDQYGVPEFFSGADVFLLRTYQWVGYKFDFVAIPIFKKRLRMETESVIIHQERPILTRHLAMRRAQHVGQNVNLLGEVVVGNAEADARYHHYLEALTENDINYISIKISGIYAQLHPLNFRQARLDLIERIAAIYRQAIAFPYVDDEGVSTAKFVNLDMEEYKDAHLTMDVFKSVLSMPEFKHYTAGIVIQAYLPDACHLQQELLEFAKERVAAGGAPLKMRLVKGANLQMESVVSSLRGWPNPVLGSKVEVDANYLRILDRALLPENVAAVRVGVASHNLFSIGYAYLLSQSYGVQDGVTFEMLEGMAGQLWRAMRALGNQVILYTPVVSDANFLNAVSYLVRRLDENTGPENFLSYSFNLEAGSEAWNFLQGQFDEACVMAHQDTCGEPTRVQDRNVVAPAIPSAANHNHASGSEGEGYVFKNEADTDFDLYANKLWAEGIARTWRREESINANNSADERFVIPVQVGEKTEVGDNRHRYVDRCSLDRANGADSGVVVYEMCKASQEQIERIISIAECDAASWRHTSGAQRQEVLLKVAENLAARRGDLIGVMCAVTGKTITEGDVEVSEAIDFCRFYPASFLPFENLEHVRASPKGSVLVISPWNFPLAIPVGGVAAALSAGNTVILKPATAAAPVAWEFAKAFWDAGVSRSTLQVVVPDSRAGLQLLTRAAGIQHMIFTGGTDTAKAICADNPRTPFSGETGGKNVVILTEQGDRDKAIMNVVSSAFGNAGQKCSACSLFLVEKGVYNDPDFKRKLKDAVESLHVGSVWELGNVVGPMIDNENVNLNTAISSLEQGEEWLVAPRFLDRAKYILAPTVKWGVKPKSFTFRTELFAPLLAVSCVDSLEEAIRLVNGLDYGLTSGLQSLNEAEQRLWVDNIIAGNLYINRGITGAIVNRQPFGGMKLSAFGAGVKAGGPNYVASLANFKNTDTQMPLSLVRRNYQQAWEEIFAHGKDVNMLYGELNELRYLPVQKMVLRVMEQDSVRDVEMVVMAARVCGAGLTISIRESDPKYSQVMDLGCPVIAQTPEAFLDGMMCWSRVRTLSAQVPDDLYKRAAQLSVYVCNAVPVNEGRVELLHYLHEQSISYEYHRYGSITEVPAVF